MLTATLRTVGGSVMVAIPKPVLEGLGLVANEKVALHIEGGRLILEPRPRPRYTLEELVAACDMSAEAEATVAEWDALAPVGREAI